MTDEIETENFEPQYESDQVTHVRAPPINEIESRDEKLEAKKKKAGFERVTTKEKREKTANRGLVDALNGTENSSAFTKYTTRLKDVVLGRDAQWYAKNATERNDELRKEYDVGIAVLQDGLTEVRRARMGTERQIHTLDNILTDSADLSEELTVQVGRTKETLGTIYLQDLDGLRTIMQEYGIQLSFADDVDVDDLREVVHEELAEVQNRLEISKYKNDTDIKTTLSRLSRLDKDLEQFKLAEEISEAEIDNYNMLFEDLYQEVPHPILVTVVGKDAGKAVQETLERVKYETDKNAKNLGDYVNQRLNDQAEAGQVQIGGSGITKRRTGDHSQAKSYIADVRTRSQERQDAIMKKVQARREQYMN